MTEYEKGYLRAIAEVKRAIALHRTANQLCLEEKERRFLFLFIRPTRIVVPCVEIALESLEEAVAELHP